MLSVYSRHYPPCTHRDIYYRRCRCPKWLQGALPDGSNLRQSANTRSWEKAELTARTLEAAADPLNPMVRIRTTIAEAIQCFREAERSNTLSSTNGVTLHCPVCLRDRGELICYASRQKHCVICQYETLEPLELVGDAIPILEVEQVVGDPAASSWLKSALC